MDLTNICYFISGSYYGHYTRLWIEIDSEHLIFSNGTYLDIEVKNTNYNEIIKDYTLLLYERT